MSSSSVDDLFPHSGFEEPQEPDPGGYPIPFPAGGILSGTRLDSIPDSLRYWATSKKLADNHWYEEVVAKNVQYEEYLCRNTAGAWRVPFGNNEGKRLDEVDDGLRYWAVHPDRSHHPWYQSFVKYNDRYEQEQKPGYFPFPSNLSDHYSGKPIKDIPQDTIWWYLRDSNRGCVWYKPLYEANRRFLDQKYQSRSPGSEPIWFGTRYLELRLDQVCQRLGFIRWCMDPKRRNCGWRYRLEDLLRRLKEWREAHPERSRPRQRRSAPNIQNPVGEAVGPWDDGTGSAAEDEDYELDDFVQADSDAVEYDDDDGNELSDHGSDVSDEDTKSDGTDIIKQDEVAEKNNINHEPDEELDEETSPASPTKRRRSLRNVISSDDEDSDEMQPRAKRHHNMVISDDEELEGATSTDDGVGDDVIRLGRHYRVPNEDSDKDRVQTRRSARSNHYKAKRRVPHSSQ